jgi:hypothetical protein
MVQATSCFRVRDSKATTSFLVGWRQSGLIGHHSCQAAINRFLAKANLEADRSDISQNYRRRENGAPSVSVCPGTT